MSCCVGGSTSWSKTYCCGLWCLLSLYFGFVELIGWCSSVVWSLSLDVSVLGPLGRVPVQLPCQLLLIACLGPLVGSSKWSVVGLEAPGRSYIVIKIWLPLLGLRAGCKSYRACHDLDLCEILGKSTAWAKASSLWIRATEKNSGLCMNWL